MACWLYEGILVFAVLLVATFVFSVAVQMRSGIDALRPLLIVVLMVVAGAYCSWCWSHGRQTLPMRTWRIRVVDGNGATLTQPRAVLRFIYCLVWFGPVIAFLRARPTFNGYEAGFAFVGWVFAWALLSRLHPQRQFWHDAWAGTRLIPDERPR